MKLCSTLAFVLMGVLAHATTVIQPTFNQLVDDADQVVVAEAVSSSAAWQTNATGRLIFTTVRFRIEEVLKGKPANDLELSFLGGTVGHDTFEVSGMPRFHRGGRFILFVSSNRAEICPLVGMFHGKFNLQLDPATGQEILSHHNGRPVQLDSQVGPVKATLPLRHLTADEFKQRVRSRAATR